MLWIWSVIVSFNKGLPQALGSLSIEDWNLVISYKFGFILREQIRRNVPEAEFIEGEI
ncbi:hypothetical protein D3C75_1129480 [compost metagenome]